MKKNDLLKCIAETGYNVGFGAKKHFSTFDIVGKLPRLIALVSTGVGIFALIIESPTIKYLSAAFIVLGVAGLYISLYDYKKEAYAAAGAKLTDLFNKLKALYFNLKASEESDLSSYEEELKVIEKDFQRHCISEQIVFSDWFAHYKFFWQHQIDWIDEQKQFRFFRDKLPLSFSLFAVVLIVAAIATLLILFLPEFLNNSSSTTS